jgi:signal transduction histidine kinase
VNTTRVLAYARDLQRATTLAELLDVTQQMVTSIGYPHAWLFIADDESGMTWRLIDFAGSKRDDAWIAAPTLRVEGDPMLEEIRNGTAPVVVEDARTDPRTNKQIVEAIGNRTIINVPLRLLDRTTGSFGVGTFGDEGVRPPTPDDLALLAGMGEQLAVAAGRIRFLEQINESRKAEQASAARLRVLASSTRWFASLTSDVKQLVGAIVRTLAEELQAATTAQLVNENGELEVQAVHDTDEEFAEALRDLWRRAPLRPNEGIGGRVIATQKPVLVENLATSELLASMHEVHRDAVRSVGGIISILAVPLVVRDRVIGVLTLRRVKTLTPFTLDDQQLAQDLADRAALAIENATLFAELEARVAARTRELELANRDLEAFSYSVAHDLRAPLRAMGHFAVAILEDYGDRIDSVGRDYLARIQRGGDQMQAIIDGLLALARLTKKDILRERVDLGAIASTVVGSLADGQPGRTIDVVIAPEMNAVGDPVLIRALYENLIGNAWKFTRHRERARIEIGVEQREGERVYYVRDNGAGFDQSFVDKLFAPFQRLHAATEFEGSGIGLATAHKIVSRHGGRIWAEGATGEGATLRFTLPPR